MGSALRTNRMVGTPLPRHTRAGDRNEEEHEDGGCESSQPEPEQGDRGGPDRQHAEAGGRWIASAHRPFRVRHAMHRRLLGQCRVAWNAALITLSWCARGRVSSWPVAASHTRAVWSSLAVTTRVPSGLNAALTTKPWCARVPVSGWPVAASHTRAVWSSLAVTSATSSGRWPLTSPVLARLLAAAPARAGRHRRPGDDVVDRCAEHLGHAERDHHADLDALGHDLEHHAVRDRQRALDVAPVPEPRPQRSEADAHVLLLLEDEIAMRHQWTSRRAQNAGSIRSSWIVCTRTL